MNQGEQAVYFAQIFRVQAPIRIYSVLWSHQLAQEIEKWLLIRTVLSDSHI